MSATDVCRHCGALLEEDRHGRRVSCCSVTVRGPSRPPPAHGGGGVLRRGLDRVVDLSGDHPGMASRLGRLAMVVLVLGLLATCGGLVFL